MSITERVKLLGYPLDQCVVIGSGLLDALDLRRSGDIDLAVSAALFDQLRGSGGYRLSVRHGEEVLERDDVEIWQTWGQGDDMSFHALYANGVSVDGVRFAHPDTISRFKLERDSEKDKRDLVLIAAYRAAHPYKFS